MKKFHEPILVVAPHLMLPTRDGGDISIERVARHLSSHTEFVDLVGCQIIRRYRNAEIESEVSYSNKLRGKLSAAIRTLLFRTHFLHERFNTPAVLRIIHEQFQNETYGMVLASFFVTLAQLPDAKTFFAVWTHNDEIKLYCDLAQANSNPLARLVAKQSIAWLQREIPRLAQKSVFLHVTKCDKEGYDKLVPGHRHIVTGIGTDIDEPSQWPQEPSDAPVILSFVGGLGVQMARDALNNFHAQYEPKLRSAFGLRLKIQVVGSHPGAVVQELCKKTGWELHKDVSDLVLSQLLRETTFTILPFSYSNGIKLKLFRSLGSGTPFLSTTACRPRDFQVPIGCCFSDNADDWVSAIHFWFSRTDQPVMRQKLYELAKANAWPTVVEKLATTLIGLQAC